MSDINNLSMGKVKSSMCAVIFSKLSVALGKRLGGYTYKTGSHMLVNIFYFEAETMRNFTLSTNLIDLWID